MVTLNCFYKDYLNWIMSGACHDAPFKRNNGLCTNLSNYLYDMSDNHLRSENDRRVIVEMRDQFLEEGLDEDYPFNQGIGRAYREESYAASCHWNPLRVQWVKDRLAEVKVEG